MMKNTPALGIGLTLSQISFGKKLSVLQKLHSTVLLDPLAFSPPPQF